MLRIILLLFTVFMLGCGTSKQSTSLNQDDNGYLSTDSRNSTSSVSTLENPDRNRTLKDHLLTVPGISLNSGMIVIRGGVNSFSGVQEPLYVVDGNAVGGFANANGAVRVQDIAKVTILKGSAAAIYGTRGQNGVIVISSRKGQR